MKEEEEKWVHTSLTHNCLRCTSEQSLPYPQVHHPYTHTHTQTDRQTDREVKAVTTYSLHQHTERYTMHRAQKYYTNTSNPQHYTLNKQSTHTHTHTAHITNNTGDTELSPD